MMKIDQPRLLIKYIDKFPVLFDGKDCFTNQRFIFKKTSQWKNAYVIMAVADAQALSRWQVIRNPNYASTIPYKRIWYHTHRITPSKTGDFERSATRWFLCNQIFSFLRTTTLYTVHFMYDITCTSSQCHLNFVVYLTNPTVHRSNLLEQNLNGIIQKLSNHARRFICDVITHPFPHFSGGLTKPPLERVHG